jgi:hypothetical protein
MAENSKREQIILAVVAELMTLSSVDSDSIKRRIPSYEELMRFALPQLPVIAVVGGLPKPVDHKTTRIKGITKDIFISDLTISLFTYFQDHVDPDSKLSNLLDDIWAKLYADQTKGGLVVNTTLSPNVSQDYWDPFYAFKVDVVLQYTHDIGGI